MSIIKKKWGKHDKIDLLAKTKLNTIEILISGTLLGSYIIHDKSASVNSVLQVYNEMIEEMKNPKNAVEYTM